MVVCTRQYAEQKRYRNSITNAGFSDQASGNISSVLEYRLSCAVGVHRPVVQHRSSRDGVEANGLHLRDCSRDCNCLTSTSTLVLRYRYDRSFQRKITLLGVFMNMRDFTEAIRRADRRC